MKTLIKNILFAGAWFFTLGHLSATYIFIDNHETLDPEKQAQLFDLILKGEPPRSFYEALPLDLIAECEKIDASLHLEWIPPALWQIAAIHAFFHDQNIRDGILNCSRQGWDPIEYEDAVHSLLPYASHEQEVAARFDQHTQNLPGLCDLFFQINRGLVSLYRRSDGSDIGILKLAISEIPLLDQWSEKQFPFWNSPWIYNPQAVDVFYKALTDVTFLSELLQIERRAHGSGEWVLYRGYAGNRYPSTLQFNGDGNHALSFGSTLLGGSFYSLEASALTYSKPDAPVNSYFFLALRVTPREMKDLFRVGPLHPFVQLIANGELFHAHTKIASRTADAYLTKPLEGYFMECNKHCFDPISYILTLKITPEELENQFRCLCERSGHILMTDNHDY